MFRITRDVFDALCDLAYREYPLEMCGLIAGPADGGMAVRFYPCRNDAASGQVYTLNPTDFLRATNDADDHDWEILGVVHSHTHSEPYPSPTDVAQAPDPGWHYLIVSLKREAPELRSYRIVDATIAEEPLAIA